MESGRDDAVPATNGTPPLLEARGISKSFLHVQALDNVDFRVDPGEVVALVGDNGAGKSTLMKILCGAYQADAGSIFFDGQPVTIRSRTTQWRSGIAVVYQDLALVNHRDVATNVFLGAGADARPHGRQAADGPRVARGAATAEDQHPVRLQPGRAPLRRAAAGGGDRPGRAPGRAPDLHGRADGGAGRAGAGQGAAADRGPEGARDGGGGRQPQPAARLPRRRSHRRDARRPQCRRADQGRGDRRGDRAA